MFIVTCSCLPQRECIIAGSYEPTEEECHWEEDEEEVEEEDEEEEGEEVKDGVKKEKVSTTARATHAHTHTHTDTYMHSCISHTWSDVCRRAVVFAFNMRVH